MTPPHMSSEDNISEGEATAGGLLRSYRQASGLALDVLAKSLHVSAVKLEALENNRLDALPDAMFARALSLAVCRHLKTDAAPVLALLPKPDTKRLAYKSERGLDFPLERPSFLPQSSFVVIERWMTPVRWLALLVLMVALALALWPDLRPWLVFTGDAHPVSSVVTPLERPNLAPLSPSTLPQEPTNNPPSPPTQMVVTPVYSNAVTSQPSHATATPTQSLAPVLGVQPTAKGASHVK